MDGGLPGDGRAKTFRLGFPFLFLRYPGAALACLGEPDRDSLLAAFHLLAGAAAAQRAGLALLHRAADFLASAFRVFPLLGLRRLLRLLRHEASPTKQPG